MPENRDAKCAGCDKRVDMYLCTRTLVDSGWLFFCDECASSSTWANVVNKAVKNEKQKQSDAEQ